MEAAYVTVEFFRKLPQDGEIRPSGTDKKGGNAPPEPQEVDRYGEGHYRYGSKYFHTHITRYLFVLIKLTQFGPNRHLYSIQP